MKGYRNTKRKPIHPGVILRDEFMADYGLSVSDMADMLGVSRQSINELIRERRGLSTEMALRLASCFGNSPEQWLNMQRALDIWEAERLLAAKKVSIRTLSA
jgi:addiction module HigA family antidote